jgi:LPXTG-site transpeptidase (sortase) family protein
MDQPQREPAPSIRRRRDILLDLGAFVLIAAGTFVLVRSWAVDPAALPVDPATLQVAPPITSTQVDGYTDDASGTPANRLRIARLGIDAPITEGDGVGVPLTAAAHYPGTAWPGSGSNIYLYAHARRGLFRELWKVRTGDNVELSLVDGRTATYQVAEILPLVKWDALEYLDPTATEQVTLQTCLGYETTSPRFIVIARPAVAAA